MTELHPTSSNSVPAASQVPHPRRSPSRSHLRRPSFVRASTSHNPLSLPDLPFTPTAPDTINIQDIAQLKRYEDFMTIDWVRDAAREEVRRRIRRQDERRYTRRGLEHYQPWGLRIKELVTKWYSTAQTWLVLTLVGIAIGLNSSFLSIITDWLSDIKHGRCTSGFYLSERFCCWGEDGGECDSWRRWSGFGPVDYFVYTAFAAILASSAAILVKLYAPYAAGSGISEIKCIIAGFVMKGFLGFWTLVIKSLALPLTIGSGLSVGKEGPSVHYAVCTGNVISRMFSKYRQNAAKTREILLASSAAGVGVAFGSPIGGVLFSIEEMSNYFSLKTMWRSYFCALIATWVLKMVNPLRTGQLVLFTVKYDRDWHFFEIVFYVLIGILGGLYGAFVIRWNLRAQAFRKRYLGQYPAIEATFLAAVTALLCYPNAFLRVDMTRSMGDLFRECESGVTDQSGLCDPSKRWSVVTSLSIALVVRVFLIIISYGCKVPAGIFVPSMATGALFGRLVGTLVQALQQSFPNLAFFSSCHPDEPCVTPGTYAFLGAGAALSGIMHITVSVVVIMFELTGALTYILPTMIVVGVTKATSERFGHGGIAERMIWFNGFPFPYSVDGPALGVTVGQVMSPSFKALYASGMSVADVQELLRENNFQGYPVVEGPDSDILIGYVDRTELQYPLDRTISDGHAGPAGSIMVTFGPPTSPPQTSSTGPSSSTLDLSPFVDFTPISVHPNVPLETVMDIFTRLGPRVIMVVHQGILVGLVTVKDCLRYQIQAEYGYVQSHGGAAPGGPHSMIRLGTNGDNVRSRNAHRPHGFRTPSDRYTDPDQMHDSQGVGLSPGTTGPPPPPPLTVTTTTADQLSALDHRREERLWELIVRVAHGLDWAGEQVRFAAWEAVVKRRKPTLFSSIERRVGMARGPWRSRLAAVVGSIGIGFGGATGGAVATTAGTRPRAGPSGFGFEGEYSSLPSSPSPFPASPSQTQFFGVDGSDDSNRGRRVRARGGGGVGDDSQDTEREVELQDW